jgi:hypothetical protein
MSPEEPLNESASGISRRRLLKRIGAGAAVAWTAPVVTSMRTPAFAQGSPAGCDRNDNCGCDVNKPCNVHIPCGPGGTCACWVHPSSQVCLCLFFVEFCGGPPTCPGGSDSECQPGFCCTRSCCGLYCFPPCGASIPQARGGSGARTTL